MYILVPCVATTRSGLESGFVLHRRQRYPWADEEEEQLFFGSISDTGASNTPMVSD